MIDPNVRFSSILIQKVAQPCEISYRLIGVPAVPRKHIQINGC